MPAPPAGRHRGSLVSVQPPNEVATTTTTTTTANPAAHLRNGVPQRRTSPLPSLPKLQTNLSRGQSGSSNSTTDRPDSPTMRKRSSYSVSLKLGADGELSMPSICASTADLPSFRSASGKRDTPHMNHGQWVEEELGAASTSPALSAKSPHPPDFSDTHPHAMSSNQDTIFTADSDYSRHSQSTPLLNSASGSYSQHAPFRPQPRRSTTNPLSADSATCSDATLTSDAPPEKYRLSHPISLARPGGKRIAALRELWEEIPLWNGNSTKQSPGGRQKIRPWARRSRNPYSYLYKVAACLLTALLVWRITVWAHLLDESDVGYVNPDLFANRVSHRKEPRVFEPFSSPDPERLFNDIILLPTSIDPSSKTSSSPTVNILLHMPTTEKLSSLDYFVSYLTRQTYQPSNLTVICPTVLISSCRTSLDRVFIAEDVPDSLNPRNIIISAYSNPKDALSAIYEIATGSGQDLTLYVEGVAQDKRMRAGIEVGRGWLANLVRASGTSAYGGSIISNAGIAFDMIKMKKGNHDRSSMCTVQRPNDKLDDYKPLDVDKTVVTSTSRPVHIPSPPFLLRTSWFELLTDDFHSQLPISAVIATSLWSKAKISSVAIPFGGSRLQFQDHLLESEDVHEQFNGLHESYIEGAGLETECLSVLNPIQDRRGLEQEVAKVFVEFNGSKGLSPLGATGPVAASLAGKGGRIALFAKDDDVLNALKPIACALTRLHEVVIFVMQRTGKVNRMEHASFTSPASESVCNILIWRMESGITPEVMAEHLSSRGTDQRGVDVVIYVKEDVNSDILNVLNANGAIFRRTVKMDGSAGGQLTAIGLPADQLQYVEWIAALPIEALRHWHTPRIDISVITNDRPYSLQRLMKALSSAIYLGDTVHLNMHLEQTADYMTQRIFDDFEWAHGPSTVKHRVVLGGVMPAIAESWYPAHNDSYGVLLEDDVEVSPLFYSWLKFSLLFYRYTPSVRSSSSRLFGISLNQQKNNELRLEGRRPWNSHELLMNMGLDEILPYVSQVPCSWGAVYFPEVWKEFHSYLGLRLSEISMEISDVIVPDIKSNRWKRSWKKYFNELVFLRGYVMLYPNYADSASFSVNHMEKGTHIHETAIDIGKRLQFAVPLMRVEESLLDLPGGTLPVWESMPVFDLWGQVSTESEIVQRGWVGAETMAMCPKMWSRDGKPTYNARELLCRRDYVPRKLANELMGGK